MTTCPVCESKVTEEAKFCAECGAQLSEAAAERAWIISMQESIRAIRHNDVIYTVIAVVGIVIAVAIPFLMRYVLHFDMDYLSWILTAVGVVFFIACALALWSDDGKVKRLIADLKAGPPEDEYEEGEEEDSEKKDTEV